MTFCTSSWRNARRQAPRGLLWEEQRNFLGITCVHNEKQTRVSSPGGFLVVVWQLIDWLDMSCAI